MVSYNKDYIDPDLMDALADSDVASQIAEKLLKALDTQVKNGTDITELEGLLIMRLQSDKQGWTANAANPAAPTTITRRAKPKPETRSITHLIHL